MVLYFKFWFLCWLLVCINTINFVFQSFSFDLVDSFISHQHFVIHFLDFQSRQSCHLKIEIVLSLPLWFTSLKNLVEFSSLTIGIWRFFRTFKTLNSVSLIVINLFDYFVLCEHVELCVVVLYPPFVIHRICISCFIAVIVCLFCISSLIFMFIEKYQLFK